MLVAVNKNHFICLRFWRVTISAALRWDDLSLRHVSAGLIHVFVVSWQWTASCMYLEVRWLSPGSMEATGLAWASLHGGSHRAPMCSNKTNPNFKPLLVSRLLMTHWTKQGTQPGPDSKGREIHNTSSGRTYKITLKNWVYSKVGNFVAIFEIYHNRNGQNILF